MPSKKKGFEHFAEMHYAKDSWTKDGLTFYVDRSDVYEDEEELFLEFHCWNYITIYEGDRIAGEFRFERIGDSKRDPDLKMNRQEVEGLADFYDVKKFQFGHWTFDEYAGYIDPVFKSDLGFTYFESIDGKTRLPDGRYASSFNMERFVKLYNEEILPQERIFRENPGLAGPAMFLSDPSSTQIGWVLLPDTYDKDANALKAIDIFAIHSIQNQLSEAAERKSSIDLEYGYYVLENRDILAEVTNAIKSGLNADGRYSFVFAGESISFSPDDIIDCDSVTEQDLADLHLISEEDIKKNEKLNQEREPEQEEDEEPGMTYHGFICDYKRCWLEINRYGDGSLAIEVVNAEDGPISMLTVCLDDKEMNPNYGYLDTNNNPNGLEFIKEYNLGTPTGFYGASGYCKYPMVKWNMDELEMHTQPIIPDVARIELDPEDLKTHAEPRRDPAEEYASDKDYFKPEQIELDPSDRDHHRPDGIEI